ncbi:MAG: uroporphyrinogen decarboxylase family protein [Candidatus Caldatribacteriaceae bacterium]
MEVPSLLKKYESLYVSRETRILDSRKRITASLHAQRVERVPVVQYSQAILFPRHEIFFSREKNLIQQLQSINLTLEHDTDYVPYLDPFEGVTILAEAFGCEVEVPVNGDPWIKEPLIRRPEEVYALSRPRMDNPVYQKVLETLRFFETQTNGIIPVACTDPQSPLDVALLMWESSSFLIALREDPDAVHHLLRLVTEAFIEFYSLQLEVLRHPAFPGHSFPLCDSSDGISISDDAVIFLSAELFAEFDQPYLEAISEAFGGLYYHSCGDFGACLREIIAVKGLRAINGHLSPKELRPEYLTQIVEGGKGVFVGLSDREVGWENCEFENPVSLYEEYYLPQVLEATKGKGVVLTGYGGYSGYLHPLKGGETALIDASGHWIGESFLVNVPTETKNAHFRRILALIERFRSEHHG